MESEKQRKKELSAIRKKTREQKYGVGVITRGKNAGMKKGTGTQKPDETPAMKRAAYAHMKKHGG